MIKVYFLEVETIDGTEQVAGIELIHHALLLTTPDPDVRKLIMDTSPVEHEGLLLAGAADASASQADIDQYHAQVTITPPNPDRARASVLLASSPQVITQVEMWELMRIFGRLHGIPA